MNQNPKRRRPASSLLSVLPLALALLFTFSCAKEKEAAERPPRSVVATAAIRGSLTIEAEYAARILPARQVNITPKVGGRVARVEASVGDLVGKGQVLFTLESGDFDAQYRSASAVLGSAKANLTRNDDAGQGSQVLQAQASYDQALLGRDEVRKGWDKTKRLFEAGAVAKQQMDDVDARLRASEIQLEAARKALDLVRDKAGPQASEVLAGQVEGAQAQVDLAKSQLDSASVLSPLAGRVSWRDVEPGALVGTSTLAFVVIDDSTVLAEAGLSDRSVSLVRKGMELMVVIPALGPGSGERKGLVDWVNPAADPRSLLYAVRISLPNAERLLRPGMLAKIRFPIKKLDSVLLIPERASFSENGLDFVMIASEGRAARRQLVLGLSNGALVEVKEGLAEGELVVTGGQDFLVEGDRILIEEP